MKRFIIISICFIISANAFERNIPPTISFKERAAEVLRTHIMQEANWAMKQQPITITSYSSPRSAGGKHDFFSEADYWWPDPQHPDSPYIQKDGMTNPDNFVQHRQAMIRLSRIVGALSSAFILTHNELYVKQALIHCKAWFADTATMMNPNLQFAQAIKGRATGRGIGIIDTIQLMEVVQSLLMMEGAKSADPALFAAIRHWVEEYLHWLTTHKYGQDEMNAANNHGTCWVMQVAAFARFTRNDQLMDFCRERFIKVLLPGQMAADGSFPLELKRTKPFGYSLFNLDAMATICQILSTKENNLWTYQTADGKSIKKGIEYLSPFIADKSKWPNQKDVMYWIEWPVAQPALLFGATAYAEDKWFNIWKNLDHSPKVEEVIRNLPIRNPLIWLEEPPTISAGKIFGEAGKQTEFMLQEISSAKGNNTELVSPRTIENGELKLVAAKDWTSGFFPGELWFLYEYNHDPKWKTSAEAFTANIEKEKWNGTTHDMGFKIYSSFGNGYRLTKDEHYKEVIIQAAKTLSTRFNPVVGCIRSWDHSRDKWAYPVIIDNMMNLELLFEATKLTGDSSFYKIAVSHANTTMKNHYRSDYSSYHVVDYDTLTGKVIKKNTHQGYSDESAWSRGQAWGLYAYTVCYRETKNKIYLQQAEHIADFIFHHPNMPKDLVPYWDFNAPGIPNEPRDASAAAVIASGLYELSTYSKQGKTYKDLADKIIENLTNGYRSPQLENHGFILLHSTGSKPQNSEVDVPIDYADYYYLEALLRMKKLNENKPL